MWSKVNEKAFDQLLVMVQLAEACCAQVNFLHYYIGRDVHREVVLLRLKTVLYVVAILCADSDVLTA